MVLIPIWGVVRFLWATRNRIKFSLGRDKNVDIFSDIGPKAIGRGESQVQIPNRAYLRLYFFFSPIAATITVYRVIQ